MLLGSHNDEPATGGVLSGRHVEPATLINNGEDDAAQIDDAFQKFGRPWQPGDLLGNAGDFIDCFNRKRELIPVQFERQEAKVPAGGFADTGNR